MNYKYKCFHGVIRQLGLKIKHQILDHFDMNGSHTQCYIQAVKEKHSLLVGFTLALATLALAQIAV